MQYRYVALVNTSIGALMSAIDGNIVVISLPTIGRELPNTSVFDLLWILLGYQLLNASVLVNFGRLSDMFGRVKLYKLGFIVFTFGSALCSLSQSGDQLVAFRVVQAVGAAFLASNSGAILTDAFPVNERGRALGINQVSMVVGSVAGLSLGGVLTSLAGWQSIFWVNIPIGVVAILWAHFRLREMGKIQSGQKIDIPGNVTLALGIVSILSSISLYSLGNLPYEYFVPLISSGFALMAAFVFIERRVRYPMFKLSLFRIRLFTAGVMGSACNSTARGAVNLVLSLYLQGPTMNLSSIAAGLYLIPNTVSLAVWGPVSGALADRWGARLLSTTGIVVSLGGFLLLSTLGPTITFTGLLLPLLLIGSGFGMYATPNRTSVMNSVPPENRGVSSGIFTTTVQTGSSLSQGIAFLVMSLYLPASQIQKVLLTHGASAANFATGFLSAIHAVNYISAGLLMFAIIPSAMRGKNVRYEEAAREPEKAETGQSG